MQELLDILNDDYKGGLKSKIPVASLMQDLEQEKSRLHSLSADVVTAQNALRYLVNLNPGSLPRGTNFYQIETSYPSIGVLPATVLANRPDVAFAEAQFHLARHEVKVTQTYLLPAVQLDNFFGHIRQGVSFSAATDAYTMWTIDPSVFGEIAELNSVAKRAYYAYIDTVRKALQEVANDYAIHEIANTRYQDILRSYQAAQEVDSLNQALYKEGIIAYKKVLLNRLNVDRAALKLNSIKLVQMLSLVSLYQDLGGGYRS